MGLMCFRESLSDIVGAQLVAYSALGFIASQPLPWLQVVLQLWKAPVIGKRLLLQIWMNINFSLSAEQQVFLVAFLDFHVVMSVNPLVKLWLPKLQVVYWLVLANVNWFDLDLTHVWQTINSSSFVNRLLFCQWFHLVMHAILPSDLLLLKCCTATIFFVADSICRLAASNGDVTKQCILCEQRCCMEWNTGARLWFFLCFSTASSRMANLVI